MTLKDIIIEALHDPQNRNSDGSVKWNWVDSDLWLHPMSKKFSDKEKMDALDNFPDSDVPVWGTFTPRVTHPLCLLYTSPSPRDKRQSRMPSSA